MLHHFWLKIDKKHIQCKRCKKKVLDIYNNNFLNNIKCLTTIGDYCPSCNFKLIYISEIIHNEKKNKQEILLYKYCKNCNDNFDFQFIKKQEGNK